MGKLTNFLRKVFGKSLYDESETVIVWEESEPIQYPEVVFKPKSKIVAEKVATTTNQVVNEQPKVEPAQPKPHTAKKRKSKQQVKK